jgi:DtxR family Mn-dependent transcriptional regulator
MAPASVPIVLPCRGTSSRGSSAAQVAAEFAGRGLAEVADDIEQAIRTAREGRAVIALDACAGGCQARLLDARGVSTLRALNLSDAGDDVVVGFMDTPSVGKLEATARPFVRTRRSRLTPPPDLSEHRIHSTEDYLVALDTLTSLVVECGALADAPTLAAHVAHVLGVSRPSAGAMLDRLEEVGYVRRGAHKDVLLTIDGRAEADRVLRKQRILECFAAQMLGYGIDECYERARDAAPGFGDDAISRTWEALGRPAHCPHGWPIDPRLARAQARGLLALSAVSVHERFTVERVDETSRQRLQTLVEAGIEPGRALDDVDVRPAAGTVVFTVSGERRSISTVLAGSVLVRPLEREPAARVTLQAV